ncbi:putative long-chain-alcohol O-fatty-acyltransferase 1 [Camellia lanceoleosa]|uniref:Long-chain-alcohol O-fatty-acyltransferase 1 n=1 Tax=Camellia lanceoleosa TaxID=1840588 RepID=A0ACC0HB37_9ERIC|nr:putative long-chain-alcohol O-fatty-acyltransferase 1 [Camellia lanceoleosa]
MEGEIKNLLQVWFSITASLCYCYFISSKLPKGKYRLLSLLPIFFLFTLLPLHLSSAFIASVTAFFITWLASFKLLLFSFDLGPLSSNPPQPLFLFIIIACLPIRTKQQQNPNPQRPSKISEKSSKPTNLPLNLASELVVLSLLIGVVHAYRELLHSTILLILYCCMVFLMVDVLVALSNAAVRATVGLELEPPSDEPYLSTSLQDFWARRWNLMVTNTLRHTIYKPVRSACEPILGRECASLPAVLSAFLVSGLMHELLFYYVTRVSPSWETTGFFVLHGACVVLEARVKRKVTGRWRLHRAVSGPLTVGFVVGSSFWLFFPPLLRNGADVKVLNEFKFFVVFVKRNLILVGQKFVW